MLPPFAVANEVVTVAVASNFSGTARELASRFTAQSGIPVRISNGSTGKLYAQIINGAPFDVFLAADGERPRLLEETGHIVTGSRFTYATGALVLWSRDEALRGKDCREALHRGAYDRLALANPETAPYGSAAREVLLGAGLWDLASKRMVLGENITQALQFVATGNATLGLVARSQLTNTELPDESCSWSVPKSMHSPIVQQAVLLIRAREHQGAADFIAFLHTPLAEEIIVRHGYGLSR